MKILYRPVTGWPGYRVGNDGSVWSCRTHQGTLSDDWHQLRPRPDKDGYLSVVLNNRGKRLTRNVAHLVLEAFVGPCPAGSESCHWPDTDIMNNAAANLRWATHRENIADKVKGSTQARGEGHGNVKLTEDDVRMIRVAYPNEGSCAKLGKRFGVSSHQIWLIVRRRNWKHVA